MQLLYHTDLDNTTNISNTNRPVTFLSDCPSVVPYTHDKNGLVADDLNSLVKEFQVGRRSSEGARLPNRKHYTEGFRRNLSYT